MCRVCATALKIPNHRGAHPRKLEFLILRKRAVSSMTKTSAIVMMGIYLSWRVSLSHCGVFFSLSTPCSPSPSSLASPNPNSQFSLIVSTLPPRITQ